MKRTVKGVQVLQGISPSLVIPWNGEELNNIKPDIEYTVEVKKKSRKRSINANSYMWVVCQQIAERLTVGGTYHSKEDIYRNAIKDCGHFTPVPVRNDIVDTWRNRWGANGIGWVSEVLGPCKHTQGYTIVAMYHGSSTYDTTEMSRLIDCLLDECQQLGISTKSSEEIDSLIKEWGEKNESHSFYINNA